MRGIIFAALSLVVAASACAPPSARNSPELTARDKTWEEAFNAGDLEKLASIYTDDARVLGPNAEMSRGKVGVEAAFRGMIATGFKGSLKPSETMVAGDIGYSIGAYEARDAKGAVVDRGKYMETFRNVGGEWKISNDAWNSDMPAATAGPAKVIIVHKVKDDARWLAAWEGEHSRREMFAQHGAPSVTIFASGDHPNYHALLVDVADMDAFTAWLKSPDVAAAKAEDGVIDEGLTMFTPRK
jgi:ketosteroid isomerase-like protein